MDLQIEKQRETEIFKLNHKQDEKLQSDLSELDHLTQKRKELIQEFDKSVADTTKRIKASEKAILDKREWIGCFIGGAGLLCLLYMAIISRPSSVAFILLAIVPMILGVFILFLPPTGRYEEDITRAKTKAEYNLRMQLKLLDRNIQDLENSIKNRNSNFI